MEKTKVLIAYTSQSGNTKMIAEVIYKELDCDKEIKRFEEIGSIEEYDFIFIGFPILQYGAALPAIQFLKNKINNSGKDIALFVTHGMLSSPENKELNDILDTCRDSVIGSNIHGLFNCTGALSVEAVDIMLNSNNPMLQKFAAIREYTKDYPRKNEIEKARKFALEMMGKIVIL